MVLFFKVFCRLPTSFKNLFFQDLSLIPFGEIAVAVHAKNPRQHFGDGSKNCRVAVRRKTFLFEPKQVFQYGDIMTATTVIEEIKHLPRGEQSQVIQFALELARSRQLSGEKLSELARRMTDSNDPAEVERLKSEITRGFYGE
jgi:hypothetical protein